MTPRLVALTDVERFADPAHALANLCRRAQPRTVGIVLRDRTASLRQRLALGRALRDLTLETDQFLLVSDRVDLALELGADGVHLPAHGLLPSHVEALFPDALVSRAHHDAGELPREELDKCRFLLVSPAFAARKGRPALGVGGLARRLTELRASAPAAALLALGGVDGQSARDALTAGADGVAAIGAAHTAREQVELVELLGIARA